MINYNLFKRRNDDEVLKSFDEARINLDSVVRAVMDEHRDIMNKNKLEWNGRIIVNQFQRCPFVGHMVTNCVNYYSSNDCWPHCLMSFQQEDGTWIANYEIMKSGTMKISVWFDAKENHEEYEDSGDFTSI